MWKYINVILKIIKIKKIKINTINKYK